MINERLRFLRIKFKNLSNTCVFLIKIIIFLAYFAVFLAHIISSYQLIHVQYKIVRLKYIWKIFKLSFLENEILNRKILFPFSVYFCFRFRISIAPRKLVDGMYSYHATSYNYRLRFIVPEFHSLCFFHIWKDMVPFYNGVGIIKRWIMCNGSWVNKLEFVHTLIIL